MRLICCFQREKWSMPRNKRGRRPHEMQKVPLMFVSRVLPMFHHCLDNFVVWGLWFESVRATVFVFFFKRVSRYHVRTRFRADVLAADDSMIR